MTSSNSDIVLNDDKGFSPIKPKSFVQKKGERISSVLYWIIRSVIVLNVVLLFAPSLNPLRISSLINKNLSLFSCGISYDSIVSGIQKNIIKNGHLLESTLHLVNIAGLIIVIGTIFLIAGACLSLGNNKLKRFGLIGTLVGGLVEGVGIGFIYASYFDIVKTSNHSKTQPVFPAMVYVFIGIVAVILAITVANYFLVPKALKSEKASMEPKYQLFLMMLPIIALAFVFSYLPLYGWRYAFFHYEAGDTLSMDKFAGLTYFTRLFENKGTRDAIGRVLVNTFAMSGLGILTSWIPMAFAIFLSEIRSHRFRRIVQTLTTIPNFISWVLVYAIALALFSTDGFVNVILTNVSGLKVETNYLMDNSHMWLKMWAWGLWKGLGWSAIIYIASISGIDQSLYEAATVDGAGRFAKMWYITIPELLPTFFVLLLMSIAAILSNGMEQYLVFSNSANELSMEVLDLYVYNLGIARGDIPLSTVVGTVKSIVSVALLFSANGISKLLRGKSIV